LSELGTALYTSGIIFIVLFSMSAAVAVIIQIIHRVVGGKRQGK
jgi:hypothetical protein